ncbi:MAG: chromosomal replication initiator, DnaA, partial [uncultured bacterium]
APPRDWGVRLPDLLSRLQAASIAQLHAPDDALLSAVLIKLFADRQIAVPPNLIPYLVQRMDRSFAAAHDLVATLDAHALQRGRPVTRALAAELLDFAAPE